MPTPAVRIWLYVLTVSVFGAVWTGSSAEAAMAARRIVSLGPLITKNIYLLDAGNRLVGNTIFCNEPEDAKGKQKIGTVMEVNEERVLALHPDLVLASGLSQSDQVERLQRLGLQVVRMETPQSFAAMCEQLIRLGELLGLEDRARREVGRYQRQVERIQKATEGMAKTRVLLQVGSQPMFAAIPNTFPHDFITFGGGSNILAGQSSGRVGMEEVMEGNPEVILIAIMGSESGIGAKVRQQWQRFPTIDAVREHRVHVVDPELFCSPSPATFVQALQTAAALIHPETVLMTHGEGPMSRHPAGCRPGNGTHEWLQACCR